MRINMNDDNCEIRNGDGVSPIYQQREALNKKAIENLARPTPGKLGGLSNLQIFNFKISTIRTGTDSLIFVKYNTLVDFPSNVSDCVMFGSNSINGKALYYNILGIKVDISSSSTTAGINTVLDESRIEFYTLQNINGSTTSLGTKIPQPAPLNGTSSGTVAFTTSGAIQGNQYVGVDLISTPINDFKMKGIRASGLALKSILIRYGGNIDTSLAELNVQVYVDITSVSSSY